MKNIYLILLLVFFSRVVVSQDYENPVAWFTSNAYSQFNSAGLTVFKSTDAHEGDFAVRLESKNAALLGKAISGVITTGVLKDGVNAGGGQPFVARPQKLTGYYKYAHQLPDNAGVEVLLTRWNASTLKRDTVSYDKVELESAADYALFEIPLTYKSAAHPDSQLIVISSSANRLSPVPGSVLTVDQLSFSDEEAGLPVSDSAGSISPKSAIIYPNPVSHILNVLVAENSNVQIFNAEGQQIHQAFVNAGETQTINVEALAAGIYLVKVFNKSEVVVKKIVVQ